jgi:hypothetical protein
VRGQLGQEAVHDAEERLRGFLGVRHLDGHGARVQQGFQEKLPCDPGGDAHLSGLQHDIFLSPVDLILLLCLVGGEGNAGP